MPYSVDVIVIFVLLSKIVADFFLQSMTLS